MRETAVSLIPKEELDYLKEDERFIEFITNELTNKISERIIKALEENYDIIPKKPMIQCKDCKHWNTAECHSTVVPDVRKCMTMNVFTDSDQFCKYGERITDNVKNEEVNIYKMIANLEEIQNVLKRSEKE